MLQNLSELMKNYKVVIYDKDLKMIESFYQDIYTLKTNIRNNTDAPDTNFTDEDYIEYEETKYFFKGQASNMLAFISK